MFDLLKTFEIFRPLSPESLDRLRDLPMTLREYEPNELIVSRNEPIRSFNFVVSGRVKTNEYMRCGKELVSAYYFEGDAYPFYLVFGGVKKYPYHIYSARKTEILHVPVTALRPKIEADPALLYQVLTFVARYTCYNKLLIRATQYTRVNCRLAYWLLHSAGENHEVLLPGSQEALSDILQVNRSSLNQELKKLEKEGLISIRRKIIRLMDLKALEALCGE